MLDWLIPFNTVTRKKRAAGIVIFGVLLTLFLLFNRLPKFGVVEGDLDAVTGAAIQCFQGFCIEAGADTTLWSRWWDFSLTYLELVTIGMTFAFLVAGVTEAFLFPTASDGRAFSGRGLKGTLQGLIVGPALTLCSACVVPVSSAFRNRGASVEATISIVQGSATLNLPAMIMGSGGAGRFKLPLHGQYRPGIRRRRCQSGGRDYHSLAKRRQTGAQRHFSRPGHRYNRAQEVTQVAARVYRP